MDRSECREAPVSHAGRILAWTLAAGLVLVAGAAELRAADAAPGKSPSGCVACHTDPAKLQEEAKGIPLPAGSALQAGKG